MPDKKPKNFDNAATLTENTQFYTQRPGGLLADDDYWFSFATMVAFLESLFAIKRVRGIYASDAAAASGGVAIGQLYELSATNIYGLPQGTLKTRRT